MRRRQRAGYREGGAPRTSAVPSSYAMTSSQEGIDTLTAWESLVGRLTPKGSAPAEPRPATTSGATLRWLNSTAVAPAPWTRVLREATQRNTTQHNTRDAQSEPRALLRREFGGPPQHMVHDLSA